MNIKILNIVMAILLVMAIGLSVFLWSSWQKAEASLQTGTEAITNLIQINRDLDGQLSSSESELSELGGEYKSLGLQKDQLIDEKGNLQDTVALLQSQKFYLADVLDWYDQQYIYRDIGYVVDSYSKATGNQPPQTCEFATADRYQRWASLTSRMYEVTPEKMGWTPYTWIRTNVLFGSDHRPELPDYVGSLGYELRYPLVPGSWPFQEVHTTIDVFTVAHESTATGTAAQVVDLACGIKGYIYLSDDDAQTKRIDFHFGTISANVKFKYFYKDLNEAVPLLTQAANLIIHDFTIGW